MTIEEKLQAPFPHEDIEWRIGRSGKRNNNVWASCLAYISNRAIMNRLDEVFGTMGWKNTFKEWHNDSQLCGISVWDEDKKEWVEKWDGADNTNFEATKGGLSDSMKRTAVQFGIGRYLYNLTEGWATICEGNDKSGKYAKLSKEDKYEVFYWNPPELPSWALPEGTKQPKRSTKQAPQSKNKARNYTEEASKIKTLPELKKWFLSLPSEEQKKADGVKNNRKEEIQNSQESESIQFEELILKANNETDLKTISDLMEQYRKSLENYGDLANLFNDKCTKLGFDDLTKLPF